MTHRATTTFPGGPPQVNRGRREAPWWHLSGAAPAHDARAELRQEQVFICPRCGARNTDSIDIRAGNCSTCQDFTGLCAAGRFAVYPHILNAPSWHRACTIFGVVLWEVTVAGVPRRVLFCRDHDAQVRDRQAAWVNGKRIGEYPAA